MRNDAPPLRPPDRETAERELRLRLATDALGVGIFEIVEGKPIWENDCVWRIFGRERERGPIPQREFWSEVVHPDDAPAMQQALREAIAEQRTLKRLCRIRRADDGRWRWIEFSADPGLTWDGQRRLVGVVADVTARHEALERLRDSEERHRLLAEDLRRQQARLEVALQSASLGAWEWDIGSGVVQWSEGLYHLMGLPPGDGLEPYSRFLERVPAEDQPLMRAHMHRLLSQGEFTQVQHRIVRGDGQVRWVQANGRVLLDGQGQMASVVGVNADITDRKASELLLQDQARRKDEFLAMLGHELRNPLAPIMSAVGILRRGVPAQTASRLHEVIHRQALQLTTLVNDLMEASRITTGRIVIRPQPMEIGEAVTRAVEELQPELLQRGQTLDVQWVGESRPLQGDPTRLAQVLVNLLHNASKFSADGARIQLTVEQAQDTVSLTVRDEGIGIDPEALPHLFELFAQGAAAQSCGLDPLGRGGLGVGLALVQRIVELHAGQVQGASDGIGRGATFRVVLPRVGPAGEPRPACRPP